MGRKNYKDYNEKNPMKGIIMFEEIRARKIFYTILGIASFAVGIRWGLVRSRNLKMLEAARESKRLFDTALRVAYQEAWAEDLIRDMYKDIGKKYPY